MAAGYGDRALEADFGDVLDDPLEHLLVADARIDDGDPVNRDHLDALGGERHGLCRPRDRRALCEREETVQRVEAESVERQAIVIGERSEEHTAELQSLMRISYAVFCLKKKQ